MKNEQILIQVEDIGMDEWCQPTLRNVKTGRLYVDINLGQGWPDWHTTTSYGEPLCRMRSGVVFEIVEPKPYRGFEEMLDSIFVNREAEVKAFLAATENALTFTPDAEQIPYDIGSTGIQITEKEGK